MKEKELRLALVCYGGVSLAVYMHGVTKEVQKLLRASAMFHSEPDHARRQKLRYEDINTDAERETDTEPLYFELLKAIGKSLDLRVFVDTIAGASAGGINGVLLSRAIAHDLPMDSHRKMWLEMADITALMDEEHIARPWSKLYMKPFFWRFTDKWLMRYAPDFEMREKLQLFTRSRWFEPPFSGKLLTGMLLDACEAMGEPASPDASLIPTGHRLDLIVSVTDFHGYSQYIPLHDPVSIKEREHRHSFKYSYIHYPTGGIRSDFDMGHVPGLIFGARATSCFPGAFPPARIVEIDELMVERGQEWPARDAFIDANFQPLIAAGVDPVQASFIDGSVLNNKPFAEAIASVRGRPAFREVDRRIVYIDPDPKGGNVERGGAPPGFFQSIIGAASEIPRNQPVRDELASLHELSERVRRYRQIVAAARPHVTRRVEALFGHESWAESLSTERLVEMRERANAAAAVEAGYSYDGYIQLKVASVLDRITDAVAEMSGAVHHPNERLALARTVEQWAGDEEIFPVEWTAIPGENSAPSKRDAWVRFLRDFDVTFRIRRLRFVIRRLNELYGQQDESEGPATEALDEFKTSLYGCLEEYQSIAAARMRMPDLQRICRAIYDDGVAETHEIKTLMERLGPALKLIEIDTDVDEAFAEGAARLDIAHRHELVQAYVGFAFFDVLTLPLNKWQELDDVDTILVDRISPEDATALRQGGASATLMGRQLGYFAAFFSRKARENDYLWGRLHAVERLVDIVASAAPNALKEAALDLTQLKARLLRAVLEAEKPHLGHVEGLIFELKRDLNMRYRDDEASPAGTQENPFRRTPRKDDDDAE